MKKYVVVMFALVCSICSASVACWLKIGEDGFVSDVTSTDASALGYVYAAPQTVPIDILCGCYRFVDGDFILDRAKYDAWLAMQVPLATDTQP